MEIRDQWIHKATYQKFILFRETCIRLPRSFTGVVLSQQLVLICYFTIILLNLLIEVKFIFWHFSIIFTRACVFLLFVRFGVYSLHVVSNTVLLPVLQEKGWDWFVTEQQCHQVAWILRDTCFCSSLRAQCWFCWWCSGSPNNWSHHVDVTGCRQWMCLGPEGD